MKKRSSKNQKEQKVKTNTKVAGFVVSSQTGPVACSVSRSKKGVVLRCEFSNPEEDPEENSDLSGDLEGVEGQESINVKGKVLTDGAMAADETDEASAEEHDEEIVE